MKKLINKTSKYIIINIIFSIIFLLFAIINFKVGIIGSLIIYIIYICLLGEQDLIINQISLMICINVIYDMLWRKTSLNIPLELNYLIEFMSVILMFKIVLRYKKYKSILKDKIFILLCIFIIFSVAIAFSKNISAINYLMSLRIYIRFLPVYIILSIDTIRYNRYDLYLFILVNILLIPIQMKISFPDDIAGVFGISNVQTLLLFLIIITAAIVTLYARKKISVMKFIMGLIFIFIIIGIGEIKIGLVILPIIILMVLILNNFNPIKLFITISTIVIMVLVAIRLTINVSPEFLNFFSRENFKQNIINYTMKSNNPEYSLGRIENIVYSDKYILTNNTDKMLGLGVGSSMPSEIAYYELPQHSRGRERAQLYLTELYKQYGPYFGYHFSSMNIIYLESGYIGILICFTIIILIIIRGIRMLYKSNNIIDKCIASSSISVIISLIGLLFYYNYILNRSAILMIVIIISLNNNRIKNFR